jgi:hypothetical protein
VEFAEAMAARLEAEIPNLEVAITGRSPLSNSFPRASIKDMSLLMPIMFAIIVVALIGFLRSFWGTAATLMVIILSVITAMGAAGFMGVKLTPPAAIAPIIILTTAIGEETEPATERDEPGANLADGGAIVLAEIGNRLVVGRVEG